MLVDCGPKCSSDKIRLNVLRDEDIRQVRTRPSTEEDNKVNIREDVKVGMGGDNKAGIKGDDKADIRKWVNNASIGSRGNEAGKGRQNNNKIGDLG